MVSLAPAIRRAQKEGWAPWLDRAPGRAANERALMAGCRFDERLGQHAADFFPRYLRHSKGRWAGLPFDLLDWQYLNLIMPLFGWVRPDGARRFRRVYIEVAKKNGKSGLASGIGLYMLCADGEMGARVYSAATDREQANIVHGEAVNMIDSSPELAAEIKINRSTYNVTHLSSRSFYRSLSAVPASKEGFDAHAVIIDELHVWRGRLLWDALKYSTRARHQGMIFTITTAGDDMQSVCREQHDYAEGVTKGTIDDPRFFSLIYAADPKDDYTDEDIWHKANPSLGKIIDLDDFRSDFKEAQRTPAALAAWKRYSLDLWATGTDRWLLPEDWEACHRDFTAEDLLGRECWAGLDLAKTRDTTSLQLIFPEEDGTFKVLSYFWLPQDTAEEYNDRTSWLHWADAGHVYLTPGNVCDYGFVKAKVRELAEMYEMREIGYDPYNAEKLTQEIEQGSTDADGYVTEEGTGIPRVEFRQTITNFASPTAELERLILSGKVHHNGHPVMTWQIGNTNVYTDANNNKRPVKPKHGDFRKIDGPVALIMALARAEVGEGAVSAGIQLI